MEHIFRCLKCNTIFICNAQCLEPLFKGKLIDECVCNKCTDMATSYYKCETRKATSKEIVAYSL
jgi:hypothetical protein